MVFALVARKKMPDKCVVFWMQQQAKQGKEHIPSSNFFFAGLMTRRSAKEERSTNTAQSSRIEAVAKHRRRSREQASPSTPAQIATEDRRLLVPFVVLPHTEPSNSRLLTTHFRCLFVRSRLMKPRLQVRFCGLGNPSLSKASIAGLHYQYM